jgi:hypothetical protein
VIRRFFTRLLIVVLIAVCAYNWVQTQRLQAQVAALEAQPKQTIVITRAPEAPSHFGSLSGLHSLQRFYSPQTFYSLQGRWKRLQHQAGVLRSTRKKVLSYVHF